MKSVKLHLPRSLSTA